MSTNASRFWKERNDEESRSVRKVNTNVSNIFGHFNRAPYYSRKNEPTKNLKMIEGVDETNPTWNLFYPPIELIQENRGGRRQQKDKGSIKPNIDDQFKYIKNEEMIDWSNVGVPPEYKDDKNVMRRYRYSSSSLGSFSKPSEAKVNLFDEIFSPSIILHEKSEDMKDVFKSVDKSKFIPEEKSKELYEKSKQLLERMKVRKERALKDIESILDSQMNLFSEKVVNVFGDRFKILSKVDSHHFEEKIKNQFIIKTKKEETETTTFIKLITDCSDSFKIIFSFLRSRFLLHNVLLTSTYFYYLIKNEISLRLNLSLPLIRRIVNYGEVDKLLDYQIGGLVLTGGRTWGTFRFRGVSDALLFSKIIHSHAHNLRHIEILEKVETLITPKEEEVMENQRKLKEKQKKEKETKGLKTPNNDVQFQSRWTKKTNKRLGRREDRFHPISTTRSNFFDAIMKCRNLEFLRTVTLPSSLLDLHNLKSIEHDIFKGLNNNDRSTQRVDYYYHSPSLSTPRTKKIGKDSGKGGSGGMDKKIMQDILILLEYFKVEKRPRIEKLLFSNEFSRPFNSRSELGGGSRGNIDELFVLSTLSQLYDSVVSSCPNLRMISLRMLFGLKTFSKEFIEGVVKVPKVQLYYWGKLKNISTTSEDEKLDLYMDQLDHLSRSIQSREDGDGGKKMKEFLVCFRSGFVLDKKNSRSMWSDTVGVEEEDGDFFRYFAYNVPHISLKASIERIPSSSTTSTTSTTQKKEKEGEDKKYCAILSMKCLIKLFDLFDVSKPFWVVSAGIGNEFRINRLDIDMTLNYSEMYYEDLYLSDGKKMKEVAIKKEEETEGEEEEEFLSTALENPLQKTFQRMMFSKSSIRSLSIRLRYRQNIERGGIANIPSVIFSSLLSNHNPNLEDLEIRINFNIKIERFEMIQKLFDQFWIRQIIRILELKMEKPERFRLGLKRLNFQFDFNTIFPKSQTGADNPPPSSKISIWELQRKKNIQLSRTYQPQVLFMEKVKQEFMEGVFLKKFGESIPSQWESFGVYVRANWRRLSFEKYLDQVVIKDKETPF